jgi:tetratricopeptide (TPR) repeat protein
MSQRTRVVGARAPIIWLLIVIALAIVAALAVGGLVLLPQMQATRAAQARQAQVEQHYRAGAAFQDLGDWEAAAAEYRQAIALDAGYRDAQARLAEVKARLTEAGATATAVAIAQVDRARVEAQATATAQAHATATARAAPTATAQALEARYQRGLGLINLQQWAEAQAELRAVFDADPNYRDVQSLLRQVNAEVARLTPTATPTRTPTPIPTATPTSRFTSTPTVPPTLTPTPRPPTATPDLTATAAFATAAAFRRAPTRTPRPTPTRAHRPPTSRPPLPSP